MNVRLRPVAPAVGAPSAPTSLAGFGVMLPTFDPLRRGTPPLVEGARRAEELGFDSGWVGDHLTFHPPVLEALSALSAAAAVTMQLRLGTGVLLLALRNPVWAAKQLATIEAIAPGRVVLGVGAGGEHPPEWEAAGVPVGERGRRLDLALEVVARLLRGEAVDHPDPTLPVRSPALEPVPGRMLPVVVGGRSDVALRRAARAGDAWLPVWLSPERVAQRRERLAELAGEAGRPVPEILMMVFCAVVDDLARARREADAFARGQYGMPFDRIARWTLMGDEDAVAEGLERYREQGVGGFVLVPVAADPLGQMERLAPLRTRLLPPETRAYAHA